MQEHISVLQKEVIENLNPKTNENFIDATLGYAGHAQLILEKTGPKGKLLGIDQDQEALDASRENLKKFNNRIDLVKSNFTELGLLVRKWPVQEINGILIDLGASTNQLTGDRGFSFRVDAPLDMRMNPQAGTQTAGSIINNYSEKDLANIFKDFGEEPFARQIAHKITEERRNSPIETTFQLVETIKHALPPSYRLKQKTHFATNIFRALRMVVNRELENLKNILPQATKILSSGGRIGIITFHSLEDRIVKTYFRDDPSLEVLTNKPVGPTEEEIERNHAARSAKLRVARKI